MNELTALQKELGLSNIEEAKKELMSLGLIGGGNYLGELRLVGFSGDLVTDFNQRAGDFCYKHDKNVTALGKIIDIIPLAHHVKAIDFSGPMVSYNPQSPLFKDIVNRAAGTNSNCAAGPEFLVYIPVIGKFACYHAGSVSARRVAIDLLDRLFKPCRGKTELISNKAGQKWFAPIWSDSDAELTPPPTEEAREALELFAKAREKETVVAKKSTTNREV